MKKRLLSLFLVGCQLAALAQPTPQAVPTQLDFAGISVRFDEGAQRLIQQDVNALVANRKFWEAKLDRAVLYFPLMEAALLDEDVPTDFKYLAVQESSLTPDAVSTSTAVGYWQFKRETAQDQGLRVDDDIDERKNIVASTRGAARYLKKNNGTFNNWVSSLFSYYLGAGGIAKLIPADWSYAREITLDGNTDRYVLRFFAHKIALERALLIYKTTNTFSLIEYPKANGRSLRDVAGELGIDEFDLRKYNRWLVGDIVPADKDYTLVLPVPNNQINDVRERVVATAGSAKKVPDFVQDDVGFPVLRRVTTGVSNRNEPILYEINGLPGIQAQMGDNAGTLAKKAKISFSSFLRYNDMGDRDPVVVNEVYYLAKKRTKALVPYHNVRETETSRSISQRYGLRLKKLLRYNRVDRVQKLQVGRVMWLRERRPGNRPVEVIKSPTPNVIDRTPTRPVVARTAPPGPDSGSQPAGSGSIPRNASERKLYQPKLVPSQTVSTEPAQTGAVKLDPAKPVAASQPTDGSLPAPTSVSRPADLPTMAPAPVVTTTTVPDANGTQRTIIVRSDENPQGTTLATTSRPGRTPSATPANRPETATRPVTKPRPDAIDDIDGARPIKPLATGGYEELPTNVPTGTASPVTTPPATPTAPTTLPAERPKTTSPAPPAPPVTRPVTPAPEPTTRPATAAMATRTMKHTVEAGQTYYSISKLYGVPIEDILSVNNLGADDKLSVGQSLTIREVPSGFPVGQVITPATTAPTRSTYTTHTVAKGETMYRISKQYNVSIEQIKEWNQLTDVAVREGQKLKIQPN
ncbi:MAG: LysM peptidoglycan-binding domain-containing protein [Bacteroidetes bacterium]|nr:LysM peptidoglycan-binding domain-containing protein [Fibrella sp.]